jgi:AcrR family transcriptional regulator
MSTEGGEMTGTRPQRADARRNRERVLAAAEDVLAADGMSASMRAVADRAGVGLGTIYRHFPTREALYQAILAARMEQLVAAGRAATTADDPGAAFFDFLTRILDSARDKKALSDVLAEAGLDPKSGLSRITDDMREVLATLLSRAQKTGAVRPDLRMPELFALLTAVSLGVERAAWSRDLTTSTLSLVFDGLRPR